MNNRNNKFWIIRPANVVLICICVFLTILLFYANIRLFFIVGPSVLVFLALYLYRLYKTQDMLRLLISSTSKSIRDPDEDDGLITYPIPSIILTNSGEIVWYNNSFKDKIIETENVNYLGLNITNLISYDIEEIIEMNGEIIQVGEKHFEGFCQKNNSLKEEVYVLYMVDITELYHTKLEHYASKPAVMLILIDNYEESIGGRKEGETGELLSRVQNILQEFADNADGFIKKLNQDRYIVIMKSSSLDEVIANRFDLLDKVREITTENKIPVTLSFGVAITTTSLSKTERDAHLALDMALGRGGDQAALKVANGGYEFFGGFSKGVEKRTKVKTRMVATAMVEFIQQADNVIVMGHKFADFDAVGSAIGMAKACQCFDKRVNIVLDTKRNVAETLVEKLIADGNYDFFISPEYSLDFMDDDTLLIIVDTHTEGLLESIPVYRRAKKVIVIDHHRKMVNNIGDSALIFHHEPNSSSASEMVTELVQYFGDHVELSPLDAEALLSGIMLDTRNFVMRTGVRTFEASAYLRRLGADTIEAKKLFASTMDSYEQKIKVVQSAEIYKNCAIALCDFDSHDIRVVAPQAADELLNLTEVRASFVLYEENDIINISARSMGAMNVQVIMEELGGGGHHTMAATQLQNITYDQARQALFEAIDNKGTE